MLGSSRLLGKVQLSCEKSFQIYMSVPPSPSVKTFANSLTNYLHITFQEWILRRFFFYSANFILFF